MLTERDKEILRFISRFGYLCARHVIGAFPLSERVAYRRLQRLVQDGYLHRKRLLADLPRVYLLTQRGVDASGTDFCRVRNIRLQTLEHDLTVADVAVALLRLYPGSSWLTERELRRKTGQGFGNVGTREHAPDGVLALAGREEDRGGGGNLPQAAPADRSHPALLSPAAGLHRGLVLLPDSATVEKRQGSGAKVRLRKNPSSSGGVIGP
ncbi:MAG: hypothetical protein K6U74_13340 [Firmicutes bacterium]|nr:hypothetical protein [Bacillota bacterium]